MRKTPLFFLLAIGIACNYSHVLTDRLETKDIFALEYADDPQISPDGGSVVFVRGSMDTMKDRQ